MKDVLPQTTVPLGTVLPFIMGTSSIPDGWLLCNGDSIPGEYLTLIAQIGKNTPNLAGRTLIGIGTPTNSKQSDGTTPNFPTDNDWKTGDTGGEFEHTLVAGELPKHNHTINGGDFGLDHLFGEGKKDYPKSFVTHGDSDHHLKGTDDSGNNDPHNNMPPFFAIQFIIFAGN